jgi:hypothetical protein
MFSCTDSRRTTSEAMDSNGDTRGQIVNAIGREEDALREKKGYTVHNVLAHSRHRDGSMYWDSDSLWWKQDYRIVDRNESK